MSEGTCIYPGCERPVVPHPAGGPPSAFCDDAAHNALTTHQERQRLLTMDKTGNDQMGRRPSSG